jgi:kynureninase
VDRLRTWSLSLQAALKGALASHGIESRGASADRGAFVVVRHPEAARLVATLRQRGFDTDARGPWLRVCPDLLTTRDEIVRVSQALAAAIR